MKLIEVVYILALVACFAGNCACISSGTAVTNPTAFKYQASVQCPVIMCNGVIVSSKNVLTTASCVNTLQPSGVQVYVGSVRYYSGGYSHNVKAINIHPNYYRSTNDFNIAVLTVDAPFDFSTGTIQLIPLAASLAPPGSILITTGYGAVDTSNTLPDVLQRANLQAYSMADCQNYKRNRLTANMICAGDPVGKRDLCPADQGAPLVYKNELVGIYSWGCSCGLAAPQSSSPVFTSIPPLRNWVASFSA